MKKIFSIFVLVFLLASCKEGKDYFVWDTDPQEESLAEGKIVDYDTQSLYEVTSSDSLASIARKYGTTSDDIIEMNNLVKPYTLGPGMIIKVPTIRTEEEFANTNEEEDSAKRQRVIKIKPSGKSK